MAINWGGFADSLGQAANILASSFYNKKLMQAQPQMELAMLKRKAEGIAEAVNGPSWQTMTPEARAKSSGDILMQLALPKHQNFGSDIGMGMINALLGMNGSKVADQQPITSSDQFPKQEPIGKKIRVREISSGQIGDLPENEFDPALYERME